MKIVVRINYLLVRHFLHSARALLADLSHPNNLDLLIKALTAKPSFDPIDRSDQLPTGLECCTRWRAYLVPQNCLFALIYVERERTIRSLP